MAQYRQSGGHHLYTNGTASSADHVSIGIRGSQQKTGRVRRSGRSDKNWASGFPMVAVIVFLCLVLVVTVLAYYFISTDSTGEGNEGRQLEEDDLKSDADFLANVTRMDPVKVLGFGQGMVGNGRDSMYWDKDDRRRDEDYDEDDVEHARKGSSEEKGRVLDKVNSRKEEKIGKGDGYGVVDRRGVGLYNEDGRKELRMYEEEYEASLKNGQQSKTENASRKEDLGEGIEAGSADNDYDDGIDAHDPQMEEYGDSEHDIRGEHLEMGASRDADGQESSSLHYAETKNHNIDNNVDKTSASLLGEGSTKSRSSGGVDSNSLHVSNIGRESTKSRSDPKRKPKHRKVSGSSCVIKFLNSTTQLVEPFESRKLSRFSLQYAEVEKPGGQEKWEPRFAGHQTLQEREESFLVLDNKINCGFVKGPQGSPSTGFDLSEDDENYISKCHIAVVSCIFGNSDRLRSPVSKMVTRLSRKNVCFVMFVDEITLQTLSSEGQMQDTTGFIGLWKIVVVKNLPYDDMRRVGKIPKLLPHRLFPSARYSIWLDSKLRLQHDPLLVLEYFLWRKGYEYAISNHYNRHCLWEEVAQNKRLNKYNHSVIDEQFSFYRADGLKRFNSSDSHKLLPSNVPEGSLIVRAHTPMSNLFSCLWFNEVDRFTPRDQLSFAYTYQKLRRMNPDRPFYLNMFKDCERRAIAKLYRHRSQEKRNTVQEEATE